MAEMGYCPSGRLFEAAACGVPILSDGWDGLDQFFTPGTEILVARTTEDVLSALAMSREELAKIGQAARDRALAAHTAERRADELEAVLELACSPSPSHPVPARSQGNSDTHSVEV
jgi:spore maturation protein CgeB